MSATFNFGGKRVLITGAGKGLGRELSIKLHECGATVVALSRTQSDLDSLKKQLPGLVTLTCDISDWQSTRQAVESVLPIHYLINNAAIVLVKPFLDITEQDLVDIFSINLNAIANISQVVAKDMIARKEGGSIVNVSSTSSKIHIEELSAYCATKGALSMLTKSMGFELAPHNIRVNAVLPTGFLTQMSKELFQNNPEYAAKLLGRHPTGRLLDIHHVVDTILFLLSDLSVMMVGSEVLVDGGLLSH